MGVVVAVLVDIVGALGRFQMRQAYAWQLALGLSLMPSYFAGLALSMVIRPRLAGRNLRPVVLAIAALTGAAAILRALT